MQHACPSCGFHFETPDVPAVGGPADPGAAPTTPDELTHIQFALQEIREAIQVMFERLQRLEASDPVAVPGTPIIPETPAQ